MRLTDLPTATVADLLSWRPCPGWPEKRIRSVAAAAGWTVFNARDVLALESVPVADRLRVVLREQLLPAWILRLFAADCTLRTLINVRRVGREPDQRSWDAVRVVRDYALGRATAEDLSAAWSAARSAAYAADAADRAAWSTSWAAYAADAWASEQEEQVARLLALLDAAQERDLAEWEE